MGEVIVITSGKGGVGKTTTTANIGTGLAQMDKKVILIDTDIGLRNLDVVMGLENRIVYNLVDVIEGNCRLKQAVIRDRKYPNLYLIPSAQTKDKTAVNPEQMKKLTEELKDEFDYILLDCPAGIEQGFLNAIAGATRAIVVTTPEVSAIRDADRVVGLLEAAEMEQIELANATREGILALIRPVITFTDGLCVAMIRWIPAALASCARRQIASSTSPGATIIRSASSSTIMTICGIFFGLFSSSMSLMPSTFLLYPFRSRTPYSANF